MTTIEESLTATLDALREEGEKQRHRAVTYREYASGKRGMPGDGPTPSAYWNARYEVLARVSDAKARGCELALAELRVCAYCRKPVAACWCWKSTP